MTACGPRVPRSHSASTSSSASIADATIPGSRQVGSFVGAYGGGLIYDALGSYSMAWRIGVAVGLAAGIVQIAFALIKPTAPPLMRTA
jgi:predicted MFS family arabinose efflux permease